MIDADLTLDKIKKVYRKARILELCLELIRHHNMLLQLSFLVHPDKNPDDKDRAQLAFDGG